MPNYTYKKGSRGLARKVETNIDPTAARIVVASGSPAITNIRPPIGVFWDYSGTNPDPASPNAPAGISTANPGSLYFTGPSKNQVAVGTGLISNYLYTAQFSLDSPTGWVLWYAQSIGASAGAGGGDGAGSGGGDG